MKLAFVLVVIATVGLTRTSLAMEPGMGAGVGGHGIVTTSAGGHGAASIGLSSPGPTSAISGGRGVSSAVGSGGFNRSTNDGFNTAGTNIKINGGKGRTTMETVPGRSPTYLNILTGRREAAMMGAIGQ